MILLMHADQVQRWWSISGNLNWINYGVDTIDCDARPEEVLLIWRGWQKGGDLPSVPVHSPNCPPLKRIFLLTQRCVD